MSTPLFHCIRCDHPTEGIYCGKCTDIVISKIKLELLEKRPELPADAQMRRLGAIWRRDEV